MKVRIVCDGFSPGDVHVYDAESGEELLDVVSISFIATLSGVTSTITRHAEVEVETDAEETKAR